jgi:hypothetical protein
VSSENVGGGVVYETAPPAYVVERLESGRWLADQGFAEADAAVAYAVESQELFPEYQYRVVKRTKG